MNSLRRASLGKSPSPTVIRRWSWSNALRRHLRHGATGIVSVGPRFDGGGAQTHARISAMAFSAATGIPYRHVPVQNVAHALDCYGSRWDAAWEDYFGLSNTCDPLAESALSAQTISGPILPRDLRRLGECGAVLQAEHFHCFTDLYPSHINALRPELRTAQSLTSHVMATPFFEEDAYNLAVHLRRGDVSPTRNHERFTSADTILRAVDRAKTLKRVPCEVQVHVFTNSDDEDVALLRQHGHHVHLEKDPFVVLDHLTSADALIVARSSFSYVAGLLSSGTVIYEPFWHPPMPDWISASDFVN